MGSPTASLTWLGRWPTLPVAMSTGCRWGRRARSHTIHVVQAFAEREGRIVPVEPKACPAAGSARALAARLAQTRVGVIAWSRMGDPELGDWGPPEILLRTGVIPDEWQSAT